MSAPFPAYVELFSATLLLAAIALGVNRWRSSFHKIVPPRPGTRFRLRCGDSAIEAVLDACREGEWSLAPSTLLRGEANFEKGFAVHGEYPSGSGLLCFRTEITSLEDGRLSLKAPESTKLVERRSEPRERNSQEVFIEQRRASCIDLSPLGGRFETDYQARRGERVRLDFPQRREPIFGWVLETYPNQVRVRFEDRLALM